MVCLNTASFFFFFFSQKGKRDVNQKQRNNTHLIPSESSSSSCIVTSFSFTYHECQGRSWFNEYCWRSSWFMAFDSFWCNNSIDWPSHLLPLFLFSASFLPWRCFWQESMFVTELVSLPALKFAFFSALVLSRLLNKQGKSVNHFCFIIQPNLQLLRNWIWSRGDSTSSSSSLICHYHKVNTINTWCCFKKRRQIPLNVKL